MWSLEWSSSPRKRKKKVNNAAQFYYEDYLMNVQSVIIIANNRVTWGGLLSGVGYNHGLNALGNDDGQCRTHQQSRAEDRGPFERLFL